MELKCAEHGLDVGVLSVRKRSWFTPRTVKLDHEVGPWKMDGFLPCSVWGGRFWGITGRGDFQCSQVQQVTC